MAQTGQPIGAWCPFPRDVVTDLSRSGPTPHNVLMKRRFGHLVGPALLLALIAAPAVADANDGLHHHRIVDTFAEGVSGQSEISAFPDAEVQKIIDNVEGSDFAKAVRCETLTDGACATKTGLSMRIYLPTCTATITTYCVEGMGVSSGAGAPVLAGSAIGNAGGRTYPADAERGTPAAGTPSLWQVAGTKNAGGTDTYAVKVLMDAFMLSTSKTVYVFTISAVVEPFTQTSMAGLPSDGNCTSWQRESDCGRRADFADGQRVSLSLRLPNTVTGWLNGRLKGSAIDVAPVDASTNRLRVEADPVLVPEVNVALTDAEFNTLSNPSFFRQNGVDWNSVNAGNGAALEWIRQLAPVMGDKATDEHTSWAFSTIKSPDNKCLNDRTRLVGLVTTNAAVYEPGAPQFADGFLNYRVGGLHYRPDGKTLAQGTYDLLMRSDVARCLYGFTNAPLSATVSVSYGSGGDQQVATAVLSEKDGWMHLGAYGFTFSTPTLKVALKGTKSVPPTTAKPKVVTTCSKGKLLKKFNGSKCPAGWKKK